MFRRHHHRRRRGHFVSVYRWHGFRCWFVYDCVCTIRLSHVITITQIEFREMETHLWNHRARERMEWRRATFRTIWPTLLLTIIYRMSLKFECECGAWCVAYDSRKVQNTAFHTIDSDSCWFVCAILGIMYESKRTRCSRVVERFALLLYTHVDISQPRQNIEVYRNSGDFRFFARVLKQGAQSQRVCWRGVCRTHFSIYWFHHVAHIDALTHPTVDSRNCPVIVRTPSCVWVSNSSHMRMHSLTNRFYWTEQQLPHDCPCIFPPPCDSWSLPIYFSHYFACFSFYVLSFSWKLRTQLIPIAWWNTVAVGVANDVGMLHVSHISSRRGRRRIFISLFQFRIPYLTASHCELWVVCCFLNDRVSE